MKKITQHHSLPAFPNHCLSSLKLLAKSAGVTAAAVLHFVQHLPSKNWSNSGQSAGMHRTSRQRTGSALLSIGTPPCRSLVHERSSGTVTFSAQQRGQQVPASSGLTYLKGGLQSMGLQLIPSQVSTDPAAPGEYTGYLASRKPEANVTRREEARVRVAAMAIFIGVMCKGD